MILKDIAGIFTRHFVIGFFIPTFFALLILWRTLSDELIPNQLQEYEGATAVAIIGAVALPFALVLSGLAFPIIRIYEGYFLTKGWIPWLYYPLWPVARILVLFQRRAFDKLASDKKKGKTTARSLAAYRLDRYFPPRGVLLPTRFGNTIRAWEYHAVKRWGLDTIAVWPRVEQLLSEQERQLHDDARTVVSFFVNSSLAAFTVGGVLAADWIFFRSLEPKYLWWVAAIPASYLLYRQACEAAARWGTEMRSSIDIHRLDLYERLGMRPPQSDKHERELAKAVNECLVYGIAIPDEYRRTQLASTEERKESDETNPTDAHPNTAAVRPRRSAVYLLLVVALARVLRNRRTR